MGEIKPGAILVADPRLQDPLFGRSVILMLDEGRIGLDLSKPCAPEYYEETFVASIGTDPLAGLGDKKLYPGGPVGGLDAVLLIEKGPETPGTRALADTGYRVGFLTGPEGIRSTSAEKAFVSFGYSGWDEGQLADEISYGMWKISSLTLDELLDIAPEERWQRALPANSRAARPEPGP